MGRNNVKYTYKEVKTICEKNQLELLSKKYINNKQNLVLRDENGYMYYVNLNIIKNNTVLNKFGNHNPFAYRNIQLWFKSNSYPFQLISKECRDIKDNLILKDKNGYFYVSKFSRIQRHIFPERFNTCNPYTLDNIKLWLKETNSELELLSSEYKGASCNLVLRDKIGYIYTQTWANLMSGRGSDKFNISNIYTLQNIKLWLSLNSDLELLSTEYISCKNNKLTFKDVNGYFYFCSFDSIVQSKNHDRFHKSNPYTIQNIELWCKLNNKPFELISKEYKNNIEYLKWKCLKNGCGEIFNVGWDYVSQGGGCPFCAGHQVGISNCLATKNPKLASEWHPTKNGDLTPYDITSNNNNYFWWQCKDNPKHEWQSFVYNRHNKNTGCPYCSGYYASEEYNLLVNNPKLCEEWDYSKNDKKPEDHTPMSGEYVYWRCIECGHKWRAKINDRNKNNGTGCTECSSSKGEKECKRILDLRNVYYFPQKEFDGLLGVGNGNLSYDFYLPEYNLLIEYQGEFHDGTAYQQTTEQFEYQKEHDRRKKEYAKSNGYNFLEIWYWDFDKIEEILEIHLNNF